jgi:hypothetical protein
MPSSESAARPCWTGKPGSKQQASPLWPTCSNALRLASIWCCLPTTKQPASLPTCWSTCSGCGRASQRPQRLASPGCWKCVASIINRREQSTWQQSCAAASRLIQEFAAGRACGAVSLLQFFQQRREKFVQHTELVREEEEGSLAAEPGATRPGQAAAANKAGRSTRSGIVSAGPTAPLARERRR